MKYEVTIVEKVTHEIEVEADNAEEAEELASNIYSEDQESYITDSDFEVTLVTRQE